MPELKVKVGPKGQVLIPKMFRDRYWLREGSMVVIEPLDSGILIRGRPSPHEVDVGINEHVAELRRRGIKGPKLGELKRVYLEMEFGRTSAKAIPRR